VKLLRLVRLYRIRRTFVDAYRLLRDARVPLRLKLIALGLALLILSPLNILGDIPFIGLVDDVALMSMLAGWFVGAAMRHEAAMPLDADELSLVVRYSAPARS
jgi:uncharacterized membrane protein YkvA (DUF1232 family)